MKVEAKLVAEGVGLPALWLGETGWFAEPPGPATGPVGMMHLSHSKDPQFQTAFGVALKLDEWEYEASGPKDVQWASTIANVPPDLALPIMADRVRHIGMDHAIRRTLGWEVQPGTLAVVEMGEVGVWSLTVPNGCALYGYTSGVPELRRVPALADITDPDEALKAIYQEVCCG